MHGRMIWRDRQRLGTPIAPAVRVWRSHIIAILWLCISNLSTLTLHHSCMHASCCFACWDASLLAPPSSFACRLFPGIKQASWLLSAMLASWLPRRSVCCPSPTFLTGFSFSVLDSFFWDVISFLLFCPLDPALPVHSRTVWLVLQALQTHTCVALGWLCIECKKCMLLSVVWTSATRTDSTSALIAWCNGLVLFLITHSLFRFGFTFVFSRRVGFNSLSRSLQGVVNGH